MVEVIVDTFDHAVAPDWVLPQPGPCPDAAPPPHLRQTAGPHHSWVGGSETCKVGWQTSRYHFGVPPASVMYGVVFGPGQVWGIHAAACGPLCVEDATHLSWEVRGGVHRREVTACIVQHFVDTCAEAPLEGGERLRSFERSERESHA